MPLIAITGAIGAGKSEFTRRLAALCGAESIDTDRCARDLLEKDPVVAREVGAAFGDSVLDAHGRIERAALREATFDSPGRRQALEEILHPRIRAVWTGWAQKRKSRGAILLVEIPLLYETDAAGLFDYSLAVGCSRPTQLRRLVEGRQLSPGMAERMMASQWKIEDKIARCDGLIWNDGSRRALEAQTALCLTRLPGAPSL